ncbi:MAG: hypothetical protein WD335_00845 [Candidatus Paceibacterota bacterium]
MKKNIVIIVLFIAFITVLLWPKGEPSGGELAVTRSHTPSSITSSEDITCEYPQTLSANYQNEQISHEIPEPETNPIIITYSNIQTEEPTVKFIDATQTISESKVIKLVDDEDKFMFLEGAGDSYLTVHTIYKNTGISTYTKQISLLGTHIATSAVGTCR